MQKKAGMSEVKFKVRHNTLIFREFSVADMLSATGLNPESIRTELQRMRREGLLTTQPLTSNLHRRGGRPMLYKLTEDPEKRLDLSREIESFFPEPPQHVPLRPSSHHYQTAVHLLDQVAARYYKVDREEEIALQQADEHLKFAKYEEEMSGELIRAYVQREQARLEYLRGRDETAEVLFREVREAFTAAKLDQEIRKIDEHFTCIQFRRLCLQKGASKPDEQVKCMLESLKKSGHSDNGPLIDLLVRLLYEISRSTEDKVLVAAWQHISNVQMELSEMIRKELRPSPQMGSYSDYAERGREIQKN